MLKYQWIILVFLVSCKERRNITSIIQDCENHAASFVLGNITPSDIKLDSMTSLYFWVLPYAPEVDYASLKLEFKTRQLIDAKRSQADLKYKEALFKLNAILERETAGNPYFVLETMLSKLDILILLNISKDEIGSTLQNGFEMAQQLEEGRDYYFLKLLLRSAEFKASKNRQFEAMAEIHYGLYLMETISRNKLLNALYADYLTEKAHILVNENLTYAKTAEKCLDEAISIYKKNEQLDKEAIAKINLSNIKLNLLDTLSAFILLQDVEKMNIRSRFVKMYNTIHLGFYYLYRNQNRKAIGYFSKGKNILNSNECYRIKKIHSLALADAFIALNKLDSARYHLNEAMNLESCEKGEAMSVRFNALSSFYAVETNGGGRLLQYKQILKGISVLAERRQLASLLFMDEEEYHLDDFYVQNTAQILELLSKNKEGLRDAEKHLIIKTLQDTKARELKRSRYLDQKTIGNDDNEVLQQIRNEINKRLSKIDDFKDTNNYGNKVYMELYQLYRERDQKKSLIQGQSNMLLAEDKSQKVLELSKTHQLLDFLFYKEHCYYTYINNGNFKLGKVDTSFLSSKIKFAHESLLKQKNCPKTDKIGQIFPLDIDKNKSLIIFPDGILSYFPFEVLANLPDNIFYHHDLWGATELKPEFLQKARTSFFSYSDENTVKYQHKLDFPELFGGLEECNLISKLLGKESKLYKGSRFSVKIFNNALQSDIIHISSHAETVPNMRQHCYFLLRKGKEPEKYYGSDLPDATQFPKFVCLNACETGVGNHITGQGTYSLSRNFLAKGAKAVLKTLWKIDDEVSKALMLQFYKNWSEGISAGDALRLSKQNIKQQYPCPYYWAGYVLEGNPNLYLK